MIETQFLAIADGLLERERETYEVYTHPWTGLQEEMNNKISETVWFIASSWLVDS